MWNLQYTIPTFVILSIFLVYYIVRPKINTRINRTFILLILVETATMITNYVSTSIDNAYASYSIPALYFANIAFFICYVLRSFLFAQFTIDVLELTYKTARIVYLLNYTVLAVCLTLSVINPWIHAVFSMDSAGYHSGPAYIMMLLHFLYYTFGSMFLLLFKGRNLSLLKYISILAYTLILILGIFIRYLFPHLVIMDLFTLLAIIIQFLTFQNPDIYLEKRTHFFNRYAFETTITEVISTNRSRNMLGMILKNYTDNRILYGSTQMDTGLKAIANYLRSNFSSANFYYLRNGEFIIESRPDVDLMKIKEEISNRFISSWNREHAKLYLQVGFVIADQSVRFDSTEQFMDCLEATFHQVDQVGMNECLVLDEARKIERKHYLGIKRSIETAIKENNVKVYLQPIVDAKTKKLVGAEALARLEDPNQGFIMPGDFIALAEENGSIISLGEQIFRKVCEFMEYNGKKLNLSWINVNLSPIQCMDTNLPEEFMNIINEYRLSPNMIHLEITEQENVDHTLMKRQIQKMTAKGFSFVLDDYGTGYSNIDRIKNLPLINVKMDMSIVWEYFDHPDSILPLSIQMLRDMGFSVTAEGVETEEMALKLQEMGCTYLQGYYFSKPLPMTEFYKRYSNITTYTT